MMSVEKKGVTLTQQCVKDIIIKYWAPSVILNVQHLKEIRDQTGFVFDLKKDMVESFIETYKLMKERNPAEVDFVVKVCFKLPDAEGSEFEVKRFNERNDRGRP